MTCTACGCEQIDGFGFCKACGARLTGAAYTDSGVTGQQPWMPLGGAHSGASQSGPHPYGSPSGYVGPHPGMQMQRERVRQNLQPMGILWCVWGAYRLTMGCIASLTVHAIAHHGVWFNDGRDFIPEFMTAFLPIILLSTVVMAGLALLTGYGLLNAKPWGRTLALIMAILSLIKIPLGTALGIYTLWVLAPRSSGLEYEALADSTPERR